MTKSFTLSKCAILFTILICIFAITSQAQTDAPKMKFRQPQLVSGVNAQKDATYKFTDVMPGVDAFVTIENIVNGATLLNIDDSTLGYYDAWQPSIGSPGVYGSSYIKWSFEFKATSGEIYTFPVLDASAVDIDGDNSRVREFVDVNGQSSYGIPNLLPSLLSVTNVSDTDNVNGDDPSTTNLHTLGPVANRPNIDTISQDVRIDYHFTNKSKIKIYTGSQIDDNGSTGGIAPNRYHCIYFMKIESLFSIVPVTYNSFDAIVRNNKVNLSWLADEEKVNDVFEIQRSFDQKDFKTIGLIMGSQPASSTSGKYNFSDGDQQLINHKEVYYRLKYVDVNGKISYSSIKKVVISTSTVNLQVQVLPNPYMDRLNINFVSEASGTAELRLFNTSGNLVKKIQSQIGKGYNNLQLQNLNSQAPGIYIVSMIINGKVIASQKLVKQ